MWYLCSGKTSADPSVVSIEAPTAFCFLIAVTTFGDETVLGVFVAVRVCCGACVWGPLASLNCPRPFRRGAQTPQPADPAMFHVGELRALSKGIHVSGGPRHPYHRLGSPLQRQRSYRVSRVVLYRNVLGVRVRLWVR